MTEFYATFAFTAVVAAYLGALAFGAAAVAPLAVTLLPPASAATLLRAFWVRFHRFGVTVGVAVTLLSAAGSVFTALPPVYATLLVGLAALMTICLYVGLRLIPAINLARDSGDAETFNRLHRLDVVLVAAALLLGALLLMGLVYALPAQFTPH